MKCISVIFDNLSTFKGYRILAADDSDIYISFDFHNKETLCNNHYNQFYLNVLESMVDNTNCPTHSIILADRGYESYKRRI